MVWLLSQCHVVLCAIYGSRIQRRVQSTAGSFRRVFTVLPRNSYWGRLNINTTLPWSSFHEEHENITNYLLPQPPKFQTVAEYNYLDISMKQVISASSCSVASGFGIRQAAVVVECIITLKIDTETSNMVYWDEFDSRTSKSPLIQPVTQVKTIITVIDWYRNNCPLAVLLPLKKSTLEITVE